MKRLFKILLWSTIGLITFLSLIIVTIAWLFNPNDYKLEITQFIQDKTGRTLTITGDIQLSFFPWFGIELGQTTLSNAEGFEQPHFASIENATLRVKLLPLLSQQIEIDTIIVDNIQLALTRHSDGKTNWSDLLALGDQSDSKTSQQKDFNINGIELNHAYVSWDDQAANNHYELVDANLRTDHLILNQAFNAEFHSKINSYGKNPIQGTIAAKGIITLTPTKQKISALQTQLTLQGNSILSDKQPLVLQSKIEADIDITQSQFILAFNSLKLQNLAGQATVNVMQNQITGQINLTHFSPKLIAKDFNLPEINLFNNKDFSIGNGSAQFSVNTQQGAQIKNLQISLGENEFIIPETTIDLLNQIVVIDNFYLTGLGTKINGSINIKHLLQQPILQATLTLTNQNLAKLSPLLNTDLSALPASLANQKLTIQTELNTDLTSLNINKLQLQIGKNQLISTNIKANLPKQTFMANNITATIQSALIEELAQTPIPPAIAFDTLQLTTQLRGNNNEFSVDQLKMQAGLSSLIAQKIDFNQKKQSIDISLLVMDSLDLQLKLHDIKVNNLLKQIQWSGAANLTAFNLRKLLKKLNLTATIPATTDPHVLEKIGLSTKIAGNSSKIQLTNATLQVDENRLMGDLQINNFTQPEIIFAFDIDKLDIDPYLPPKTTEVKESKPIDLPIEMIRKLNINGQLNVNSLTAAHVKMTQVKLKITAKDGIVQFYPFNSLLYNGVHEGNIALDVKNTPARLYILETLKGIQTDKLLADWMTTSPIVGKANISAQLSADPVNIVPTLFGSISLNVADGNLSGINLGRTIRELEALLKNQPLPTDKESLQTDFSSLNGLFLANHGIIHNENLTLKSPLLRVQGKGNFVLKNKSVNYQLAISVVETSSGQGGKELEELRGVTIPLKLIGKLDSLQLQVDSDFLQNLLIERSKAQAATKLNQAKEILLEKHKDKLGDALTEHLKNLSIDDFFK